MARKPKILVEIVGASPYPKRRKCPIEGNKIILKEAREGRGGAAITAEFDNSCFIPYRSGLTRGIKQKLIVKEGATKCVSFGTDSSYRAPSVTIEEVFNYFKASVIMAAGRIKQEKQTIIYLLIGVVIILQIIGLLVSSGRIHF